MKRIWVLYGISVALLVTSIAIAITLYPSDYDWQYTVISALATEKHNPDGFRWFSCGLGLALLALWPATGGLSLKPTHWPVLLVKAGIISGIAMAAEAAFHSALPQTFRKLHELLALLCFLFIYLGLTSLSLSRIRRKRAFVGPSSIVLAPLIAIGLSQLSLYFDQRDLGWVDQSWREMGIPVWQSFAFWQWLSLAALWISFGVLLYLGQAQKAERTKPGINSYSPDGDATK